MINVLHCTENPVAGSPGNIASILNKYSTKVACRLVQAYANNGGRVFPHDLLVKDEDLPEIEATIKAADIIHFHNFYKKQALFNRWPHLWELVAKKPHVWQVHTQRDCSWVDLDGTAKNPTIARKLVIAQYHTRQYPECTPVPNMVDIWASKYAPLLGTNELPCVIYTPSNINLKGWDDKGFTYTKEALDRLTYEGLMQYWLLFDKPHADVMRQRRFADIGIDQVAVPSYHLCSLENAACGLINVVNMDRASIVTLREITGAPDHPFALATKQTLTSVLRQLLAHREEIMKRRLESRKWMEQYWDPRKQIIHYERIYESL